jgi:pimeloyl-ACP methyl ester carboxylesterase
VPPEALDALGGVKTRLLGIVGLTSMIPGSVDREMAAVDVPVFLALGEHDIAGDPHAIPACFTGCRDFTLFVLPGTGHNHNVAPDRELLWERFVVWARAASR